MMAAGVLAQYDACSWGDFQTDRVGADGHPTLRVSAYRAAKAPDKGPPRAVGFGTQHGPLLVESQLPSFVWRHLDFPMQFVLVVVKT